jgi:RimJ/RimL family protein N-acetyltransferase
MRVCASITAMETERPVGPVLSWRAARRPERTVLEGRHVRLRPLDANRDAEPLFAESHRPATDPAMWTYLFGGPYRDAAALREALAADERSEQHLVFTLLTLPDEHPAGVAAYARIKPEHGVIEIGGIWFGVSLRRTVAATEAIYLLAAHAFDELGYRRLEWKCDALNQASRRAAERFGFRFEGVFRQHMVIKGRNRDTAWYAITGDEWPAIRDAFDAWLSPENFNEAGRQHRRLGELTAAARNSVG